ncbi:hypothetical protein BDV3_004118 [Batrachochytrium dendrobatidis]
MDQMYNKQKDSKPFKSSIPFVRPCPPVDRCHHWLEKKLRYCPLQVRPGQSMCAEHGPKDKPNMNPDFVLCPFHPKHVVRVNDLDLHRQTCLFRPQPLPPYHVKNINSGSNLDSVSQHDMHVKILDILSKEDLFALIQKLDTAYHQAIQHDHIFMRDGIPLHVLTHESLNQRLNETQHGKHAVQQASLMGHLHEKNLIGEHRCYAEFGCGKGELSKFIYASVPQHTRYLLIDRKVMKLKVDRVFRANADWERVTIDIRDFNLQGVERIQQMPVIAISKHLCGVATDLTLKCLSNYKKNCESDSSNPSLVQGMVIALCCHQLCKFDDYINPGFLSKYGIGAKEFDILAGVSTWALCGERSTSKSTSSKESSSVDPTHELGTESNEPVAVPVHWTGLSFEDRQQLGIRCKRFLDLGRREYVCSQFGLQCELVQYVLPECSLENAALIAWQNKQDE